MKDVMARKWPNQQPEEYQEGKMEINNTRPATAELASLTAASVQNDRFKDRKAIEAQSDVRSDAVYFSPVIKIDKDTQAAVIQYRDEETGEVQNEYPQREKVQRYEQAQEKAPPEVRAEPRAEVKVVEKQAPPPPEAKEVKEPAVDEQA